METEEILRNDVIRILEKYCFDANLTGLMSAIGKSIGTCRYRSMAMATHSTNLAFDDYTLTDAFNKTKDDGGPIGSIHLGSHSHAHAVTYETIQINVREVENRMSEYCSTEMIKKILLSYIMSNPTGKRSSMLSNEPVSFIIGIASDNANFNTFMTAFENPVKEEGKGNIIPSIKRLMNYYNTCNKKYNSRLMNSCDDIVATFCFDTDCTVYEKNPTDVETIDEFIDKLYN